MGKDGSKVLEGSSLTPTTKIETPWDVWLSVSRGEIRGDAALMQGLYKVTGDFDLMMRWGEFFGSVIALAICAALPLITFRRKLTVYDVITLCVVGGLSAAAQIFGHVDIWIVLGYFAFGLMWLLSCFTKEPLCAAYVKYNYSGDDALQNPIFMKTNYILSFAWGILYVIISVVMFFLYRSGLLLVSAVANNAAPVLMGIFTSWFVRWYPAKVAAGK